MRDVIDVWLATKADPGVRRRRRTPALSFFRAFVSSWSKKDMMKLNSVIQKVQKLSEQAKGRMFSLMTAHYNNVKPEKFLKDLEEKDGVIVLYDECGTIQGFTTFLLLKRILGAQQVYALYSGDTIVNQQCWGQIELFRGFGRLFQTYLLEQKEPLYWFLLSKGIKTYLMLPLFFKRFYPNCYVEMPQFTRTLMEELAEHKFGTCYRKKEGIVRMIPRADYLQQQFAVIPERKLKNAHVRFFTQRNPGYIEGDELVCLASISPSNFTSRAQRFVSLTHHENHIHSS